MNSDLRKRLEQLGYTCILNNLSDHEGEGYKGVLSERLGVPPIILMELHFAEATAENIEFVARDSLCRGIADCDGGWGSKAWARRGLGIEAFWLTCFEKFLPDELKNQLPDDVGLPVLRELDKIAPRSWQPSGADDPVLRQAFDAAWKIDCAP